MYQQWKHDRRTLRLQAWDYALPGGYFVTICVDKRECSFGKVSDGEVQLASIGRAATKCWMTIPDHFPHVNLDAFVMMPNHLHGVLIFDEPEVEEESRGRGHQLMTPTQRRLSTISPKVNSLAVVVRTFKAAVTTWCRQNGLPDFKWQRNYYEHIVRHEKDLWRLREYIQNNPLQWELDELNPNRRGRSVERPYHRGRIKPQSTNRSM